METLTSPVARKDLALDGDDLDESTQTKTLSFQLNMCFVRLVFTDMYQDKLVN